LRISSTPGLTSLMKETPRATGGPCAGEPVDAVLEHEQELQVSPVLDLGVAGRRGSQDVGLQLRHRVDGERDHRPGSTSKRIRSTLPLLFVSSVQLAWMGMKKYHW
jgi:hypothetical protein